MAALAATAGESRAAGIATVADVGFLAAAREEAELGLADGGIPIGSVLVIDGTIVGRGHNQRVQKGSPTLHGEMDWCVPRGATSWHVHCTPGQTHPRCPTKFLTVRHTFHIRTTVPHLPSPLLPCPTFHYFLVRIA
jgi:hypothetical protein